MYTDVDLPLITLHPAAKDFLFKHYRSMKRIFGDVLGLLEVDYLSITLITPQNELLFLSSQPSIECNLIEHGLWQYDPCLNKAFLCGTSHQYWNNVYLQPVHKKLLHYKQEIFEFGFGLAIPHLFREFRVIYTFGFKATDASTKQKIENNIAKLRNMGQYCLQNILNTIELPNKQKINPSRPVLKLVINNEVPYAKNT